MKDQLKIGIVLNYVTIGLNAVVGLLYTPYMLRMMGQGEFGLYSLVSSIIAYLSILDFGFGNAIIRYTAKMRAEGKVEEQYKMFGLFLWLYMIIGVIALLFGVGLYFNIDRIFDAALSVEELSRARIMMVMLIFNLAITFPLSIFGAVIQAYEHFVVAKMTNIIRIVMTTIVMIVLLHLGYKAVAMVVVQTIMNVSILVFNCCYAFKVLQIKVRFGKVNIPFLKEIAFYSFWIFLMAIVDNLFWNTGQFVLGATIGTVAVAIYGVGIQLKGMHEQFSTAMSTIFLPRVTAMVSKNDNGKEVSNLFIKVARIQYIILSFVLVSFILLGRQFVNLWAGQDYDDAFYIALIFFSVTTIPLCQNLGIIILQARNQMKFRALCYCITSCLCLLLQLFFVHKLEGIGCAIAIAIAVMIGHILFMNVYYHKRQKIDMKSFWREIMKMSIFPAMFCAVSYSVLHLFNIGFSWKALILEAMIIVVLYLPMAYIFQMNTSEKDYICRTINKVL